MSLQEAPGFSLLWPRGAWFCLSTPSPPWSCRLPPLPGWLESSGPEGGRAGAPREGVQGQVPSGASSRAWHAAVSGGSGCPVGHGAVGPFLLQNPAGRQCPWRLGRGSVRPRPLSVSLGLTKRGSCKPERGAGAGAAGRRQGRGGGGVRRQGRGGGVRRQGPELSLFRCNVGILHTFTGTLPKRSPSSRYRVEAWARPAQSLSQANAAR